MYVLFEYNGRQYKAQKDDKLIVDKTETEKGTVIDVDKVLLISDGEKVSIGTPYVKGAKVLLEVGDSFRDKKVLVFKHKSKKDYHRLLGHRQNYTKVVVKDIVGA